MAIMLLARGTSGHSCPSYDAIRQPAVAAGVWDNKHWAAGPWYVQATNEKAQPNNTVVRCPCNVYEVTLPGRLGNNSYHMKYTTACGDGLFGHHNLTIPMEGFWNDSKSPGYHWESYANSKKHNPTYIYDSEVGPGGEYEWCAVYACEKSAVTRKQQYSWQLLSRRRNVTLEKVQSWVAKANALGLDTEKLEYADWGKCKSWN